MLWQEQRKLERLWLPLAKTIPVGQYIRIECPRCGIGSGSKAATVNHNPKYYNCNCHACALNVSKSKGKLSLAELTELKKLNEAALAPQAIALPLGFTTDIPLEGRQWLYSCGITPHLWQTLGIGWSDATKRVVMPMYNEAGKLVWLQQRAVLEGQTPKYLQPSATKKYTYSVGRTTKSHCAVIVEDIASAIRINATGCPVDGHSLLGTSMNMWQLNLLSEYKVVGVWLDPDTAGERGTKKLMRSLSLLTEVVVITSDKDPKKLTDAEIIERLKQVYAHLFRSVTM